MVPATFVYVYLGTCISNAADLVKGKSNSLTMALMIGGSVLALLQIAYVSYRAK